MRDGRGAFLRDQVPGQAADGGRHHVPAVLEAIRATTEDRHEDFSDNPIKGKVSAITGPFAYRLVLLVDDTL